MNKKADLKYLGVDVGGTWIKGTLVDELYFSNENNDKLNFQVKRIKSLLHENADAKAFSKALKQLIAQFETSCGNIACIGISTAGIVNYQGTKVLKAAKHLSALMTDSWKNEIEQELGCNAVVINDADAATIGIAELGKLKGNKTIGIMPVGTGLGFSVWRNGRRWRPGKIPNLLGSIRTPSRLFDHILSASKLAAEDSEDNLINVLKEERHKEVRETYINNLERIINTAAILYNLDEVMLCGGLAEAVGDCNYPLESKLNAKLENTPVELDRPVKVSVLKEGNKLQLIGAVALAKGEFHARSRQVQKKYSSISTEIPYQEKVQLQELSTSELVKLLWKAEQEAGENLKNCFSVIEEVIDKVSERIAKGGRLIYVGSGTSGRVAAMDAVEIPCTYGFPKEKALCLVAGGIADAAIEIESDFEEDASAVPEMLLMDLNENDSVIGISASGTAWYVQSALAFAKGRGAFSVLVQSEKPHSGLPFCHSVIPLNSGYEVVAGSTRMKAGTATKKILNFISTSVMVKMGKIAGPYMIDVACINNKLIERAQSILGILYNLDKNEAIERLNKTNMNLRKVIEDVPKK